MPLFTKWPIDKDSPKVKFCSLVRQWFELTETARCGFNETDTVFVYRT